MMTATHLVDMNEPRKYNTEVGKKGFQPTEKTSPEDISLPDAELGSLDAETRAVIFQGMTIETLTQVTDMQRDLLDDNTNRLCRDELRIFGHQLAAHHPTVENVHIGVFGNSGRVRVTAMRETIGNGPNDFAHIEKLFDMAMSESSLLLMHDEVTRREPIEVTPEPELIETKELTNLLIEMLQKRAMVAYQSENVLKGERALVANELRANDIASVGVEVERYFYGEGKHLEYTPTNIDDTFDAVNSAPDRGDIKLVDMIMKRHFSDFSEREFTRFQGRGEFIIDASDADWRPSD